MEKKIIMKDQEEEKGENLANVEEIEEEKQEI
jgi:hypothetical protein